MRPTSPWMSPLGETLKELADGLERMRRALSEPVLREVLNDKMASLVLIETDDEARERQLR